MSAKIEVRDNAYRIARAKEELNDCIAYVADNQHPEVIQKIREVCEPFIVHIISNQLSELANGRGYMSFDVVVGSNTNRAVENLIEEKFEELEAFWQTNKEFLQQKGITEDTYWTCVEWVPTRLITFLYLTHKIY